MAENTWSGLTPENDEKWEQLFEQYVPFSGTAPSIGGEILRAMSRIIYRFYNDGDMVGIGYGNETCNSSNRYLMTVVPKYKDLDIGFTECSETAYEEQMKENHRITFRYLMDNKGLFNAKNEFDSRKASNEDYLRSCYTDEEDEQEEWED